MDPALSRRRFLATATVVPLAAGASLAGCGHRRSAVTPDPPAATTSAGARATPRPVDQAAIHARLSTLERRYGARLGAYALAVGTGTAVTHRADERFALCSTFKTLAVAAVLHRRPLSYLDNVVRYAERDVNSISPITEKHLATGMTVRALCDAAIRYSDGTAGNLLMRDVGGPAGLTAYLRGLGDRTSRMDRYEPELNRDPPESQRDTTTPAAIAADFHRLVLGDALAADRRRLLTDWMRHSTTGGAVRTTAPRGWTVADKTGHGDYGRLNDVAVLWPPDRTPLVLALLSDQTSYDDPGARGLLADAARLLVATLGPGR